MERSRSRIRSALFPTVSAVCQKTIDTAVGQRAGPQWTRCRRFPTAFPSLIARWRNLPRVAASPKLPACLRLRLSGAATAQVIFSGGAVRAAHLDRLAKYLELAKLALEAEEEDLEAEEDE